MDGKGMEGLMEKGWRRDGWMDGKGMGGEGLRDGKGMDGWKRDGGMEGWQLRWISHEIKLFLTAEF